MAECTWAELSPPLDDRQAARLHQAGVLNCADLVARGSSPEGRQRLSQETGVGPQVLLLSTARAKLLGLTGTGAVCVREYADQIVAPDSDPVEDEEYLEFILSQSDEELCIWAVCTLIEIGEEDAEEDERRKRKRTNVIVLVLSGLALLAATVWLWGDLFPGQPADPIAQVYAARDSSLAATNLALVAGAVLFVLLVLIGARLLTRAASAITKRARHQILGDQTKLVVADAAIAHPELVGMLGGTGSRLAAILPWLGVLVLIGAQFVFGLEIASLLLVVVLGIVMTFPMFLSFRFQLRVFKEDLGPWAGWVKQRWAALDVFNAIVAAALIIINVAILVPVVIDRVASPLLGWAAERYEEAGFSFAATIEQMDLALEDELEHLTQDAGATAGWAHEFRELETWVKSEWAGLATNIMFATLGFCLGTAVFQFAFVNRRKGSAFIGFLAVWLLVFVVTDRLPQPLVDTLRLNVTPIVGTLTVIGLGMIGAIAGEFFMARVFESGDRCPNCQKSVETDFTFCPHCGRPLGNGHLDSTSS